MKARHIKSSLIASTALATAVAGGSAFAASGNPFASQQVQDKTATQLAEMSCGAGQCGSNTTGANKKDQGNAGKAGTQS